MPRLRLLLAGICAVVALVLAPTASAAPGDLDPSFGSGGIVRLLPSHESLALRAVAVQPDLKIVLAGADNATQGVLLVRLLPNGELDPSFGSGGIVSTTFPGGFGEARALALQPDGKIVIVGAAKGAADPDFLIARYNSDGSPDASFGGGDGIQVLPVGPGPDSAEAVAIGPDGQILVTGRSELPLGKVGAGVAVLKPEGEPETAFAGDGTTIVEVAPDDSEQGKAIAAAPGGRVLIGDSTGKGAGDGFTLVRLLSSGLPDPGFGGGDGVVNTPIPGGAPGADGRVEDLLVRPDGRIVAAGYGFETVPPATIESKFAAVGYLENGELDPSFAGTGIFSQDIVTEPDAAQALELTPKGQIVLAGGYDAAPSNGSSALLRLDPLGVPDSSFGSGGLVLRGVTAPFGELFEDAALDGEERTVVVSRAYIGGGNTEVVVARYLGDKVPQSLQPVSGSDAGSGGAGSNQPAHATIKPVPKQIRANKLKGFSGTASDPDGSGVKMVEIAVVKKIVGIPLVGTSRDNRPPPPVRCFVLTKAKPIIKRVKPRRHECPLRWLPVSGTSKWSFKLKGQLPRGKYVVLARATDGKGAAETSFSRALGNRYGFRVLPPR